MRMVKLDRRRRTMLQNFFRDRDRKSLPQIAMEFTKCSLDKREMAGHYFSRMLYKRHVDNYLDYLTNREIHAIRYRSKTTYEESLAAILDNKILFYLFINEYDLRIPGTFGWNAGGQVNMGSDMYEITEPKRLQQLLVQAVEVWGQEGVFVKPSEGYGGIGCRYIGLEDLKAGLDSKTGIGIGIGSSEDDYGSNEPGKGGLRVDGNGEGRQEASVYNDGTLRGPGTVADGSSGADRVGGIDEVCCVDGKGFADVILQGSFLFQEPVRQHEAISAVYPHSLNTLRIDTYIDPSGKIYLLAACIRFGANGSTVDNASSGGFFVSVDLKTGRLGDRGYQLLEHGGQIFFSHPDTGVVLNGLKVPYFNEVKQMVRSAAEILPHRLTGWDVAIAPDGPVLMEGNSTPHINGSDMAFGGFRRHSVYWEILREFTLKNSGENCIPRGRKNAGGTEARRGKGIGQGRSSGGGRDRGRGRGRGRDTSKGRNRGSHG